jgi:ribosomal protein L29
MKKTSYKGKTKQDLNKTLNEKRTVLRNFRFAVAGSKTRNVKEGKNLRKEIARILTELNKK